MVRPQYPPEAKAKGLEGHVVVIVEVGKDGKVVQVRYAHGDKRFLSAVVEAVSQWEYEPILLNGVGVPVETLVTVNFEIPKKVAAKPAVRPVPAAKSH